MGFQKHLIALLCLALGCQIAIETGWALAGMAVFYVSGALSFTAARLMGIE